MYYSVDDDGNIVIVDSAGIYQDFVSVSSGDSDILDDTFSSADSDNSFSSVFDFYDPFLYLPSVSSDDIDSFYPSVFSYDALFDVLANVPGYTIYPSTQAVSVLTDVLNGIDGNVYYVIISGVDTNDTYLYYSSSFSSSGNIITLLSPVTRCRYYSYRPSSNSSYLYTYTVDNLGDTSFTLTNQLIYTNILDGYPDVIPYKQKSSYSFLVLISIFIGIVAVSVFKSLFSRKGK